MSKVTKIYVSFEPQIERFGSGSPECQCDWKIKERVKREDYYECKTCKTIHFVTCVESYYDSIEDSLYNPTDTCNSCFNNRVQPAK